MVNDTDEIFLFCDWENHNWVINYYGTKCTICGLFFAYGHAPWDEPKENDPE